MPQYLTLVDTSPLSDTVVIKGEVLDKSTQTWKVVENRGVPANSIIRAGSVVEKTEAQYKQCEKFNMYAPVDTKLSFNLESVFSQRVQFFGNDTPLSDVLRSHSIHTIQDVVNNKEGVQPFMDSKKKGAKIKAHEVLVLYVGEQQALDLLEQCKKYI